jgi:hypothetical protein
LLLLRSGSAIMRQACLLLATAWAIHPMCSGASAPTKAIQTQPVDRAGIWLSTDQLARTPIRIDIIASGEPAVSVPRNAVIRGEQPVVFVARAPDPHGRIYFERRPVRFVEGNDFSSLSIPEGVEAGERVVVEGALLISELFLRIEHE